MMKRNSLLFLFTKNDFEISKVKNIIAAKKLAQCYLVYCLHDEVFIRLVMLTLGISNQHIFFEPDISEVILFMYIKRYNIDTLILVKKQAYTLTSLCFALLIDMNCEIIYL